MGYCTNPKCCHALTGNYIAWFAREGRDLRALLLETGVPADAATSMVLEGKGNDVAVEVIDDRRGMVAMQEFKNGEWSWSVWEIRLHQSFDEEEDAYSFGEASDAAYEARGEPPRRWTVIGFADE